MRIFLPLAILGLALVGCSSADTSTKGEDAGAPGDGKLHPAPNGTAIASADACSKLNGAISAKANSFTPFCGLTTTSCPGADSLTCASYDDGTVTGCAQYYESATTCADLRTFAQGCDVTCKE